MKSDSNSSVIIAILTYRREEALRRCISSIIASAKYANQPVLIVVGDNDPETTIEESPGQKGIRRIQIKKGSIAAGRQELLNFARCLSTEILIYVDDDEVVTTGWLKNILATAETYDCSAVAGPVTPTGITSREFPLHSRLRRLTGSQMQSAGAGNLLLALQKIEGIDFDLSWPLSGGEDTDFTYRITQTGGSIVWSDEAEINEPVLPSRRSKIWLMKRYFHNGRILHVVKQRNERPSDRNDYVRRLVVSVLVIVFCPAALISNSVFRFVLEQGIRNHGYLFQGFIYFHDKVTQKFLNIMK